MGNTVALRDLRAFIFDMDGTIYRGNLPLPGAAELVAALRKAGIPFLFTTNNSSTPAWQVAERLTNMGIPSTPEGAEVLTSADVTATVLASEMPGCTVLVVGETGIREALLRNGLELTEDHRHAQAVVVGIDRSITYPKLCEAALAVRHGALFIATNTDPTLPTEAGLVPGAGSLVGALQIATDCKARVIGKPEPELFRHALARLGTPAGLTGAIGDRSDTDIVGGQRAGLRTIAVLTGAGTAAEFAAMRPPPDWTFENLIELQRCYFGES